MNEYKSTICYDSSGLINLNPRQYLEDDVIQQMQSEKYTSATVFPKTTSGPNKGKFIPILDHKGNIVVDPASLITKDPFFIDYNLYKRFKLLSQKGKLAHREMRITKSDREEIKKLFAKHKPVCDMEPA